VIVYPGSETYPLEKRVTAWPARRIPELAQFLLNDRPPPFAPLSGGS
jgi:hypothetical protein